MASYSIILFDLDGTLTDPKVGITKSVQYALSKFGIVERDLDSLIPFIGPPLDSSFREIYGFSEVEAREAVSFYREYFQQWGIRENVLYDGIPQLLDTLAACSQLAVATSKPTVFANDILEHFHIKQFFGHVIGSNLDGTRSNKAEIIQDAMGLYPGAFKHEFVMIGDRQQDIRGAAANEIDSIGVLYGYGSEEEIMRAGATYMANSLDELLALLTDR